MASSRPNLQIAMPPPSFDLSRAQREMPKTPEPTDASERTATQPPPPPRQGFKVRRKRPVALREEPDIVHDNDNAIPTIEMSEALDASPGMSSPIMRATPSTGGLFAPMPSFTRFATPPHTPASQISAGFDHLESPSREWSMINENRNQRPPFERAGSICSSFSDSSLSSIGSSAFSVASPESENMDPFIENDHSNLDKIITSPVVNESPEAKRAKTLRRVVWTPTMDDHLWLTYMSYISDPTLTPFKMLPGTAPPLGVCHKVAAKAKRTWRDHKSSLPAGLETLFAPRPQREGSPDTIRPGGHFNQRDMKQPQWPRSESDTRKRLRGICKRRPSLSAHYQRLLRTRSPSPFQSSSDIGQSSEPSAAFSGIDMKMSLITSTNPSMQPDGPLAQLTSDAPQPRPQSQRTSSRPTDWFARIGRSQAHKKSLSLQSGLGLGTSSAQPSSSSLDSPFDELPSRSHLLHSMQTTKSLGREFNRAAPSLDSPFEVQGMPTAPRSLKRRFRSDEDKPKRLPLYDVFSAPQEANNMVRNRGFSVGAVRASDNLANLFAPPPSNMPPPAVPSVSLATPDQDHEMAEASELPDVSMLGPPGSRSVPRRLAEPTPRLGSPFMENQANSRQFNTFPRSYIPSSANPHPFSKRLQELTAEHAASLRG